MILMRVSPGLFNIHWIFIIYGAIIYAVLPFVQMNCFFSFKKAVNLLINIFYKLEKCGCRDARRTQGFLTSKGLPALPAQKCFNVS